MDSTLPNFCIRFELLTEASASTSSEQPQVENLNFLFDFVVALNEAGSSKGAAAGRRGARKTELQSGQTPIPPEQVRQNGGKKYVRKGQRGVQYVGEVISPECTVARKLTTARLFYTVGRPLSREALF